MSFPDFYMAQKFMESLKEVAEDQDHIGRYFSDGSLSQEIVASLHAWKGANQYSDQSKLKLNELIVSLSRQLIIPWEPVPDIVKKIMDRSQYRGWGFTSAHANALENSLIGRDHSSLSPVSVDLCLEGDLIFNWTEIVLWIQDQLERYIKFHKWFDFNKIKLRPGNEFIGKKKLDVINLDISPFWQMSNNEEIQQVLPLRQSWPVLQVAVLLALNPSICMHMDGFIIPYMFSLGLSVGEEDFVPLFTCENSNFIVQAGSTSNNLCNSKAAIAFLEA